VDLEGYPTHSHGPAITLVPDGRLLAIVRRYEKERPSPQRTPQHTELGWVDPEARRYAPALKLPSGGDSSYAGPVWHGGVLWMSYYSSHGGKASIYLAKVRTNVSE